MRNPNDVPCVASDTMVAPPGLIYGFISRFNADGSYAWTRAFPGSQETLAITGDSMVMSGLAATPDGGIVTIGYYSGSIDLDPGAAVESHQTTGFRQHEGFVVKLAADGSFAWGGTFTTQSSDSSSGDAGAVAIDGAGAIYVAVRYAGEVDLDPSAGTAVHTSRSSGSAAVAGALVKLTSAGKVAWVQSADTGPCVPSPASIALATDGAIWIVGLEGEGGCGAPVGSGGGNIAAYGASGALRGYWQELGGRSIAAGSNGSVYIGGGGWGFADFDPGPGVSRRLVGTPTSGGFIVKLGSDGSYLWAQVIAGGEIFAVAGAPDGGVIGSGYLGVTKLNADGTAGFTFSGGAFPGTVVSSGNTFVVTGQSGTKDADFDPGPGVDTVGAITLYLSRFTF